MDNSGLTDGYFNNHQSKHWLARTLRLAARYRNKRAEHKRERQNKRLGRIRNGN